MNGNDLIMQMISGKCTPQTLLNGILGDKMNNNPMIANVLSMMNNNNQAGLENMARNLCKERGIDPDQMMRQVKTKYRL